MTYEEFKEQGYTIELVEHATVYSEVTINESGSYIFRQYEIFTDDTELYRIVSIGNNDEHDFEEFNDMEEVEEYIKNEMQ